MNSKSLEIKLPDDFSLEQIKIKSNQLGLSSNAFIIKAIEIIVNMDVDLLKQLEAYSARFDLPVWLVMQNIIIKRLALDVAESEVLGEKTALLQEFIYDEKGPITGKPLFDMLKQNYVYDLEMKRFERIMEFKANGWDLSEADEAFLNRYQNKK